MLQDNPCAMVNNRLGICQIPRGGIKDVYDMKGCEITLIGGSHRKKAYEKVSLICIFKPYCLSLSTSQLHNKFGHLL